MKRYIILGVLVVLAIGALFFIPWKPQIPQDNVVDFATCEQAGGNITGTDTATCTMLDGRTFQEQPVAESEVVLDTPQFGDLVTSPMTVAGKARGNWFFEANIPVMLKDENGNILVQKGVMTSADWMTTDFVPFSTTLTFDPGDASMGVLIISKDNPSGLPQNDSSFAVPVRFK